MDERRPIPFPVDPLLSDEDEIAHARLGQEVAAAIALVAAGVAVRITIANVEVSDDLAGEAALRAQRAGLRFTLERDPLTRRRAMRIGPRL